MVGSVLALAVSGWSIAALLVGGLGILVTGVGIRRTWTDYGGQEPFGWWVSEPLRRWRARFRQTRVARWWRRLAVRFGFTRGVTVHVGVAGAVGIASSVSASGRVQWARLPDIRDDPHAFAVAVQGQLDRLNLASQDTDESLQIHQRAQQTDTANLRAEIDAVRQHADTGVREYAVGGLREQVLGQVLIAVGLLLQALDGMTPDGRQIVLVITLLVAVVVAARLDELHRMAGSRPAPGESTSDGETAPT